MLIDHTGMILFPSNTIFRIIGRIAFPIYCFLIVEGYLHTHDIKRYGTRLFIGGLLSEIPYDLACFGKISFDGQNVMITLMIGLVMIHLIRIEKEQVFTPFIILLSYLAAELLCCDYGGAGILVIALFYVFRTNPRSLMIQCFLLAAICLIIPSRWIYIGPIYLPIQLFGTVAMFPIALYNGKKAIQDERISRILQKGFYMFYPIHLLVLVVVRNIAG